MLVISHIKATIFTFGKLDNKAGLFTECFLVIANKHLSKILFKTIFKLSYMIFFFDLGKLSVRLVDVFAIYCYF